MSFDILNKPAGVFSASNIGRLLAEGTGATRNSYILECALASLGIKNDVDSVEMKHGRNNQLNAFDKIIKPLYQGAEWFDEYVPINEACGASPDFKVDSVTPGDIKCPYYIDTFIEQINTLPKKYYQQVQMQIMSLKGDYGIIAFYLTKPEIWGQEDWQEYPFPLSDRNRVMEIKRDDEVCYNIEKAVEKSAPLKQELVERLKMATPMDQNEFFYLQLNGQPMRRIKDCSALWNTDFIRVGDSFYYNKKR